jgi:hypothetical protein
MYLHVAGPDPDMVKKAKELCLDLLDNVKQEYEKFKERGAQNRSNYGDRNDRSGGYGGYSTNNNNQYQYGGAQSPAGQGADATGTPTSASDYAAQYAQYYGTGGQDPYAAYGGYQNYVAMYYQYYQQQQGGAASAPTSGSPATPTAPGSIPPPQAGDAPPPPPPNDSAPPPPPGGPPGSSYGSVWRDIAHNEVLTLTAAGPSTARIIR